jgi:microcystin-dependent protein
MDQFIAEIRLWPGDFAPNGWAFCDGQLLPIAQNTSLFALIGTIYGGDGKSTYALPDFQGRAPMHADDKDYPQGASGGVPAVALTAGELPVHTHSVRASVDSADLSAPSPNEVLARSQGGTAYQSNTSSNLTPMHPDAIGTTGQDQAHNNMQPYLTLNFIIALEGIFPKVR